ncbi:MAG: fatty-acid synthase [bacterium]|nr:fatty-acid synthase [bacterium]
MPARDFFHDAVKTALVKDGWKITHDPFRLSWGGKDMYVDLGVERLLAARKDKRQIAVEIKSFVGASVMRDLEQAIGQFAVYRSVLARREPDRTLYMAIPEAVLHEVFEEPLKRRP